MQDFIRPRHCMGRMGGGGGFGETGQDQFQFTRINGDIADRKQTRPSRRHGGRIDLNQVLVQVQAPIGDRAQLLQQAEERQQGIGFQSFLVPVQIAGDDGGKGATPPPRARPIETE